MRIAYCNIPKIGGTFNFYRSLFDALAPNGMQVMCVSVGPEAAGWRENDPFVYGRCVKIAPEVADLKEAAGRLLSWLDENEIDIFMPMNSRVGLSIVPFLPQR